MNEQELFTAAVERDRAGRAALLDEACGTDPELRQRLENLLKCHENGADFFDKPAAEILATAEATTIAEGPGTQIGPYKLLQQIGEGGFGVVYMAEQTSPFAAKWP